MGTTNDNNTNNKTAEETAVPLGKNPEVVNNEVVQATLNVAKELKFKDFSLLVKDAAQFRASWKNLVKKDSKKATEKANVWSQSHKAILKKFRKAVGDAWKMENFQEKLGEALLAAWQKDLPNNPINLKPEDVISGAKVIAKHVLAHHGMHPTIVKDGPKPAPEKAKEGRMKKTTKRTKGKKAKTAITKRIQKWVNEVVELSPADQRAYGKNTVVKTLSSWEEKLRKERARSAKVDERLKKQARKAAKKGSRAKAPSLAQRAVRMAVNVALDAATFIVKAVKKVVVLLLKAYDWVASLFGSKSRKSSKSKSRKASKAKR